VLGGVLYVGSAGVVLIKSCSFKNIHGAQKGGVCAFQDVNKSNVTMSVFSSCNASGNGGALLYLTGSKMQIFQFVVVF
jgi:hypothetical protein